MKKVFLNIILFFNSGCLVPPAPQVEWYKPTTYHKKILYKNKENINDVYYKIIDDENISVLSSMTLGSIPKFKHFFCKVKITNKTTKVKWLNKDNIGIISNSVNLTSILESNLSDEKIKIPPGKSIYLEYKQGFNLKKDNSHKKISDTIAIRIKFEEKVYKTVFFYNKRNNLDTYPF